MKSLRMFATVGLLIAVVGCAKDSQILDLPSKKNNLSALTVFPNPASVGISQTLTFSASGGTPPYQYAPTSGGCVVDGAGLLTAPSSAQSCSITVSDSAGGKVIVPVTVMTVAPSITYSWVPSAAGACSATCGGGTQSRSVTCMASNGAAAVDSFCTAAKPPTTLACNTQACIWQPIPQAVANGLALQSCSDFSSPNSPIPIFANITGLACTLPGTQCWAPAPPNGVVCQ